MAFSVPFLAETALRAKTGFAQQARQRELEDAEQARQDAIQRRLQDQLLLQQREAEAEAADRRSLVPLRQRLLEAQAKDAEAQAKGEGRYAPKPDQPRNIDPLSQEGIAARLAFERQKRAGGGGTGLGDGTGPAGGRPTVGEQTKGLLSASALPAFQQMIETDASGAPRFKMNRSKTAAVVRGLLPQGLENPVQGLMASMGADGITEDMQANQAATQFVDSWIRAVSGAAVPEQELQRYLQTYTPTAFDPEPVKAQKARAWVTLMNALDSAAGRAAQLKTPEERRAFALSIVANGGAMGDAAEEPGVAEPPRAAGNVAKPKSRADRWEELVAGGMSPNDATAQVRKEMP